MPETLTPGRPEIPSMEINEQVRTCSVCGRKSGPFEAMLKLGKENAAVCQFCHGDAILWAARQAHAEAFVTR